MVIFVVLVLLSRGEARFVPLARENDEADAQFALPAQQMLDELLPSATAPPEPAVAPTRTPTPTPTVPPAPTPTPEPEPTPTPEPVPTERPVLPPSSNTEMAEVITQPQTGRKEIAVTFDAGAERGYTLEILELLDRYGAVGTFGVTGEWAETNPDLVREMVERGHQVMNHGYSHDSFTGQSTGTEPMTDQQVRSEVLDTEEAVREATGGYEIAPYFRFPYGDYNGNVLGLLEQMGYDYTIWWGCDSKAWMGHTAADIVEECGREKAEPGLIVLLHVDSRPDFEALPQLLEVYAAAGYDLVSVEQLMQP